jgi:hypothetical protein
MHTVKAGFSVLTLAAALCLAASTIHGDTPEGGSTSGIVDPCASNVSSGSGTVLACPAGDGETLAEKGLQIDVTVRDYGGDPIPTIPAVDFWLIGCSDELILCGGSASSNADHTTDSNGQTTISGAMAVGGSDFVMVVVQGVIIGCPLTCLPIEVKSPDQNLDLVVNVADASLFATGYPPHPYRPESDLDGTGGVDIIDLSLFYNHFYYPSEKHTCY